MTDRSQSSDISQRNDPARTQLHDSAPEPDETGHLPPAEITALETVRRVETSLEPGRDLNETATHDPALESFDPGRTGDHTPLHDDSAVARKKPTLPGYEILGELGRGGMGVVYRARHLGLNRIVALKTILHGPLAGNDVISRLLSEARAVARFQHANIVQVFDVGEYDGLPFISLEFVDGGTLSGKIAREPQPPRYAAETVEQLARAMQYAHDRGVIHRDLKPTNILLTADGKPKITDFGLAKTVEDDSGRTQSGQVLGTPSFMAPEQARGEVERVGPSADVYALGAILYDLLTGRPPFAGSSVLDTLEMVRNREPVPPGDLTAKLPRDLETICLKCLQKDPARRYASAGELADDLRRFLDGRPILARPVGRFEKAVRWSRRNPIGALAVLLAAALVVVPSVLAVMLFISREKENEAKIAAQQSQKEAEGALVEKGIALNKAVEKEKEATQARQDTAKRQEVAVNTMRGMLTDVMKRLGKRIDLAPMKVGILEAMKADLERIRDVAAENPLENRTDAIADFRLGTIFYDLGRFEDAAQWLSRARKTLRKVMESSPRDDPNHQAALFGLSGATNVLADTEWKRGNGNRARELYAEALTYRQERLPLIREMIDKGKANEANLGLAQEVIADSLGYIAFADLRLGDPASALKNYQDADRTYNLVHAARRNSLEVRRKRAYLQLRTADTRLRLGQPEEAIKHYRAALDDYRTLLKLTPKPLELVIVLRSDIALTRLYIGDFELMSRRDVGAARREYRAVFDDTLALYRSDPLDLQVQQRLAAVHYRLGHVARTAAGKQTGFAGLAGAAEAEHHFKECLKLREGLAKIDPKDVYARIELMLALGRLGRAVEAEKLANELLSLSNPDLQVSFQIACGLAVAGGNASDPVAARRCREKALDVLEDLANRQWKSPAVLELDPDLESLRDDERFLKTVQRLMSGKKR